MTRMVKYQVQKCYSSVISSELFKFIVVVITVSNLKLAYLDAKYLADKKLVRSVTWR